MRSVEAPGGFRFKKEGRSLSRPRSLQQAVMVHYLSRKDMSYKVEVAAIRNNKAGEGNTAG